MSLTTIVSEIEMKKIHHEECKKTKPKKIKSPPKRHPRKKKEFREMLPELGLEKLDPYFDYKIVSDSLSNLSLVKDEKKDESLSDVYTLPLDEFLSEKRQFFLDTFPTGEIYENK